MKEKRFRRIKVETVCPPFKGLFDMDLNDLAALFRSVLSPEAKALLAKITNTRYSPYNLTKPL